MSDQGQVKDEKLKAEAEARRRVALAQIRQYPDPVLRMKANDVVEFDGDLTRLIERLEHLLQDANGLGLAATQIGVLRRVFIIQPDPDEEPQALVNPRLAEGSEERLADDEGCLSLQGVVIPVERHERVTIEASDAEGKGVRLALAGRPSGSDSRCASPSASPSTSIPRPTRSWSPPTACSSPSRFWSARSGSTSTRRCSRAGGAGRRSSGR